MNIVKPVAARPGLDRTLTALADPTRRAILERLSAGEARVTDIARPFAISLNSVSKHIRMLERARLVRRRRVGREHILSFQRGSLDDAATWIETQRSRWNASLDALGAMLEEEDRAAAAAGQKRRSSRKKKGSTR
jgi:DNA-binding transcriptional ArsR family regulator